MWRSSVWLLVITVAAPAAAQQQPACLPPVFDGGQRLHERPAPSVFWLEVLLRQHEICWRAPERPNELRVFLYGSSTVFGYPSPVEETTGAIVNERFRSASVPAHIFNLGMVGSFELKDMLIVRESLKYRPDLIIYAATLAEFSHIAPTPWPGLGQFFYSNSAAMLEFADDQSPGLGAPLEIYRTVLSPASARYTRGLRLREFGALLRTLLRHHAEFVRRTLLPDSPDPAFQTAGRQTHYDCEQTKQEFSATFANWQEWNIIADLARVHATTGVPVIVINWPIAHEPVDDCYNVRFPDAAIQQYNGWLAEQASARGLQYLDLHDLLTGDDFVDSLHTKPQGDRKIADRLVPELHGLLTELASRAKSRAHAEAISETASASKP